MIDRASWGRPVVAVIACARQAGDRIACYHHSGIIRAITDVRHAVTRGLAIAFAVVTQKLDRNEVVGEPGKTLFPAEIGRFESITKAELVT